MLGATLGKINKSELDKLFVLSDWVLMEKQDHLNDREKIGHIITPQTSTTSMREAKIGKIVAAGKGSIDNKGRLRECNILVDRYAYCTRYAKEQLEGVEGETYMVTRNRGVLAYVNLDSENNITSVEPRFDGLLVSALDEGKISKGGIIIPDNADRYAVDDYRPWVVHVVGPGEPRKYKTHLDYDNPKIPETKVGDIVYASNQSGVQVSWYKPNSTDNRIFRIINEAECIARKIMDAEEQLAEILVGNLSHSL